MAPRTNWLLRAVAAAALLFAAGCPESGGHSSRCAELCAAEAACARSGRVQNFGETECIAACAALENDPEGKKYVDRHAACVNEARSATTSYCDAVVACP